MNREEARYYLQSSGFSEEQMNTIEQAFKQDPKTGHWISHHHGCEYECSECHDKQKAKSKYCPNCGVKMVEPQESEE